MLIFTSSHSFLIFFFTIFLLYSTSGISIHVHSSHLPVDVEELVEDSKANTTLVLARERTRRIDIFNHFEYYNGGWNISNHGYIMSVVSTAIPFFVVAAIWFVVFGILNILCMCYHCCYGDPYGHSQLAYYVSLIFLILCTIATIGGCILLYSSEQKVHGTTSNTMKYVVSQVEFTNENLKNVSNYLDSAKKISIELGLPRDIDKGIHSVQKKIMVTSNDLSKKTRNTSKMLHNGSEGMRLALITVAISMVIVSILGFLTTILGLKCILYSLVVAGWILVAGTFILSGAFVLLHNVIGDTCVAMDEWALNPTTHTAMDETIPCMKNERVRETLLQSKSIVFHLVNSINDIISNDLNGNTISHNQSAPNVPLLCNPFNSDFTIRHCAAEEVAFENASEVWKSYTPSENDNMIGLMTPSLYRQLTTIVNVSYGLYHYGPFLVDLIDCTFVRKMFIDINNNYCPGLNKYTKHIYWALVVVSVAVMLSLIFWIVYERHLHHRHYIILS
ncbi:unnamed protein product [Trifolium pratense]|uniref:Uncharacterized protein n=1 Tax=Trifolium pratense TaxID=57577 RepID=A0ACB0IQB7_TRIPR|nr:unnamed protein product [Trifolium pratense]